MPGLQHAGVTKGIMVLLGILTLSASLLDIKPYLHLQFKPHMTTYHQYWRILSHPFAFTNSTELLMGELLLYNVGVHVERAFGSRKYASFILISSLLSTFLACGTILLLHPFGINSVPGGPYGVIFSLLWQHYRIVPSLYQFNIFGMTFSQKVFTWAFAFLLMTSMTPSSILISVLGLLAGYIYRTDTLFPLPSLSLSRRRLLARRPLKTYRIPSSIYNIIAGLFSPLSGESAPPRRADRVLPGQITERLSGLAALQGRGAGAGATAGAEGGSRPSLRSILASRLAADSRPAAAPNTTSPRDQNAAEGNSERGGTTAVMGEWVSEMTGRSGARAPAEEEISAVSSMFPNFDRETIVRALQRNDYNTAQAVEALLGQADQ